MAHFQFIQTEFCRFLILFDIEINLQEFSFCEPHAVRMECIKFDLLKVLIALKTYLYLFECNYHIRKCLLYFSLFDFKIELLQARQFLT